MNQLFQFINQHQTTDALAIMWIGSNIVSALPSPNGSSGNFYKFFFALAHGLAGSVPRVFPNLRLPGNGSVDAPYWAAKPGDPHAQAPQPQPPKPLVPGGPK